MSRSEPGCVGYRFGVDIEDAQQIHLFEEWESQEALNTHFTTPHFAAFAAIVADVVADTPTFTRYEVASSGPLFG
jgi:quinol monooxygenase YgiN